MAQDTLAAGRPLGLRGLMMAHAAVMLLFGLTLALGPNVATQLYDVTSPTSPLVAPEQGISYTAVAFGRLFGVVCVSFGALLALAARIVEQRSSTVPGVLTVVYLLGSGLVYIQQTQIWTSAVGWATVGVHLFFALGYAAVFVANQAAPAAAQPPAS